MVLWVWTARPSRESAGVGEGLGGPRPSSPAPRSGPRVAADSGQQGGAPGQAGRAGGREAAEKNKRCRLPTWLHCLMKLKR